MSRSLKLLSKQFMLEVENPENLSLTQIAYGKTSNIFAQKNLLSSSTTTPLAYKDAVDRTEQMQSFRTSRNKTKSFKTPRPVFRTQKTEKSNDDRQSLGSDFENFLDDEQEIEMLEDDEEEEDPQELLDQVPDLAKKDIGKPKDTFPNKALLR